MEEPLTEELLAELLDEPDLEHFIEKPEVGGRTLSEYLNQLLDEHGLNRAEVVRAADINETFGYQIFTEARRPSRNYLAKLSFAMHLSLAEANRVLQAGGISQLYCKNRRDAILIFCLKEGYSLQRTEEELFRFGEDTLGS